MSKVRIELNSEGIRELLHSPEIAEALKEQATRIASGSGGTAGEIYNAGTRNIISVSCDDGDALLRSIR